MQVFITAVTWKWAKSGTGVIDLCMVFECAQCAAHGYLWTQKQDADVQFVGHQAQSWNIQPKPGTFKSMFKCFRFSGVWYSEVFFELGPRTKSRASIKFKRKEEIYLIKGTLLTTVGIRFPNMSGNRMVKTCPIAEWFVNWMVCGHLWTIRPFSYWTFSPLFKPPFSYRTKSQLTEWSVDIYSPIRPFS